MSNQKTSTILMAIIAILLLANLVRPLLDPATAFAQGDSDNEQVVMTGSGMNAWILKNNEIYFIKFESQYEIIRIYGPEELER